MRSDPPPEVIASWPLPNTVNPAWRGNALVIVELVLISVVVIVVGLRIYTRIWLRKSFGIDDWIILPAVLLAVGLTLTTCIAAFRYGWGYHMWDVPLPTVETSLILSWISELFFNLSLSLTKLSLCCLYLRLLRNLPGARERKIVYILILVVTLWGIGFSIAIVVQCKPIHEVWIINSQGENCANEPWGVGLHGGLDIVTDWGIYGVGIAKVMTMKLRRKQKILLVGLFSFGAIVCIVAVVRLPITIRSMGIFDSTWHLYVGFILATIEADLAIICASLPSLTPLLIILFPSIGSITSNPPLTSDDNSFPNAPSNYTGPGLPPPAIHRTRGYPLADISTTASSGVERR